MKKKILVPCEVCGRYAGTRDEIDRFEPSDPRHEVPPLDATPLGSVEECSLCGKFACPDCLHESDCCFADADEKPVGWAPDGWRCEPDAKTGAVVYAREADSCASA